MSALKNELLSVQPKSTDVETYLSNMHQIFMILTLIKFRPEFDNICEQTLTGSVIPTFDEIFAQALCHSSIATQSRHSKVPLDTSVMISHSHPHGDSRSVVVATEAADSDLIVSMVIEWVTYENGVASYMVVHHALLMWPSLLNRLHLRFSLRAIHLRLRE